MIRNKVSLLLFLTVLFGASSAFGLGWKSTITRTITVSDTLVATSDTIKDTSDAFLVNQYEALSIIIRVDVDTSLANQDFRIMWEYNVVPTKLDIWWKKFDSTAYRAIPIDSQFYVDSISPSQYKGGRYVRAIIQYADSLDLDDSSGDVGLYGNVYRQKFKMFMEPYKR